MKPDPILAKSYEGTKGFNPLLAYAAEHSSPHPLVRSLLDETLKGARGGMASSPETCTFLTIVSQAMGARKVLDVGVFTGLSALSMGLGLSENGRVIACEINDGEAQQLARKYWKIAGIASKVDLIIQPAADTLQGLIDKGESGTFDIAFIDADKSNYLTYYRLCYALLRRGGVIIVDNTLWSGKVVDPKQNDDTTVGMRQFNEEVRNDDRVRCLQLVLGDGATVIQKL
jgi:predicted O-methyltransferase YrrM